MLCKGLHDQRHFNFSSHQTRRILVQAMKILAYQRLSPQIKIKRHYDWNQSTLASSSSIAHPLTEVRRKKNCSSGQRAC